MFRFFRKQILMVPLAGLLVACGGGNAQLPIEGEREQVVATEVTFKPAPELADIELNIPAPTPLATWPQANTNAQNLMPHGALPQRVTPAWQKKVMGALGRDEALTNTPVVAEGRLFIMTPESEVIALDAWNGKNLWRADLRAEKDQNRGLEASGGLAVAGNMLYATTSGGQVFALNPSTGEFIWQEDVGASVRAAPTIADERVYVVSHNNRLHVLDAKSGQLLWNHTGIEEPLAILGGAAPAVAQGVVAVPYSSGEIYVLKSSDGRYLWHDALSTVGILDPYINVNDIVAAPVIADDGVLYVANTSSQMAALDLQRGQEIWRRDYSATGTPVVAGNAIFLITTGNQMLGLHRETGRVKWVLSLNQTADNGSKPAGWYGPVLAGGRLMAISSDGYAVSVGPQTGELLAMRQLAKGASVGPVVADNMLYFLTDEGELLAYD